MIHVVVQHEPIDLAAAIEAVEHDGVGAIATFSGYVRADDGVATLELEHYPGMTETALRSLAEDAAGRWSLDTVALVHRVGVMQPGERIVFVAAGSRHRHDALAACAALIDQLKTNAPFWKRETRGTVASWVEHRAADEAASLRWDS